MATSSKPGVAGRTDYDRWDKVTSELIQNVEDEESREKEESQKALGLDGKYAVSEADQAERDKAKQAKEMKKMLNKYEKRENQLMHTLKNVFDHSIETNDGQQHNAVVRVTRETIDAGKRVLTISESTGSSITGDNKKDDSIILSQDLNQLECKVPANSKDEQERSVYGLIKLFISNVKNCTIIVRCKLISGTIEISHCSNIKLIVEKDATAATVQIDLCSNITVEFNDALSGKNTVKSPTMPSAAASLYWGDDKDDRIFHAGVSNLNIIIKRDGYVESEIADFDYIKNGGAISVGNAMPEEYQFVTSVVDGELTTEKVVRSGSTTGKNARAMTQREIDDEELKRKTASESLPDNIKNDIKIIDKNGNEVPPVMKSNTTEEQASNKIKEDDGKMKTVNIKSGDDGDITEEIYTSMSQNQIDEIVNECEDNKARGNEAFGKGEYAQAVLLYSLALDKADELPDANENSDDGSKNIADQRKQIFPRHIVLSNRSASFLKLGEHEKALADANNAMKYDPLYIKALFRKGLALHALGRYDEAMPMLVKAHNMEPKNKQIKQALTFCEVRLQQQMRQRME